MARLAGMVTPPSQAQLSQAPPPPVPMANGKSGLVWRAVLLGVLIAVCAIATIGFVAFLGWNLGPEAIAVGIVGAILPVPVLIGCFLWLDRYEPSPMWIMLVSFLWGAGVATTGAFLVNTFASSMFERYQLPDALVGVVVAPIIEETLKAAFPIMLFLFYRRAYTGVIDGIVYCGLSATGFAMVENILYLGGLGYGSASEQGFASGALAATAVFILRVPLTGFAHPLFTSLTGLGLGFAARSPRLAVKILAPLTGLVGAMTLHAAWNLGATLAGLEPFILLYSYFAVFMPIFFGMVGLVLWLRSWEGRLAERVLGVYASAGWFSPPEVVAVGSMGRRLSARRWARRVAGDAGYAAMRRYQVAATRLALLRDGLDRGLYHRPNDIANAVSEEHRLLTEIDAFRRVFTGRDPQTPRAWWSPAGYRILFPDGVTRDVPAPALPVVPVPVPLARPAA
jgi:RsiW-degrading membrane proteinase PrsW (M82 family)